MKKNLLKILAVLGLSLLASSTFALSLVGEKIPSMPIAPPEPVMCTMDAKMCKDGSYVARQGPNCEFALCPSEIDKPELPKEKYPKDINICTKEYKPVCAAVATGIRCIQAPCPSSVEKTFSNHCMAKNAGSVFLHEGVCEKPKDKLRLPKEKKPVELIENPDVSRIKEEKAILFIKLAEAKNEEERKKILNDDKMMKLAASSAITSANVLREEKVAAVKEKVVEKRKEILDKKSDEIFTKFDFFIAKIDTVAKKIARKNETVQSPEVTEILVQAEITLAEANRLKAEAWIVFSEIAEVETKEAAGEKISTVKKLLAEAKQNISTAFVSVKQALNFLKK